MGKFRAYSRASVLYGIEHVLSHTTHRLRNAAFHPRRSSDNVLDPHEIFLLDYSLIMGAGTLPTAMLFASDR